MRYLLLSLLPVFAISSCSKEDDPAPASPVSPAVAQIEFSITYHVDQAALLPDTILYTNAAGNAYGVTRLQYYLSQIELIKPDSSVIRLKDVHYVDFEKPAFNKIAWQQSSSQDFIGLRFNIGLDSAHNLSNILPATIENINMAWPDMMGGGYHFMKMEGDFVDSGNTFGYAMHLGTNMTLIPVTIWNEIKLQQGATRYMQLAMNINEWYDHPSIYDFNTDGNYSMGNAAAMLKLKTNGADVFTLN